jgi:ADP-heptose:LPS heptosyltransferase
MRSPRLPFKFPVAIFANAIGDHLTTLPALRALAALFPGRLSLICLPGSRWEFFSDVRLRSVCEIKMPVRGRKERVLAAGRVAERIGKCDLFLSLNPWHSRSIDRLLKLLSPALSVGFSPAFQVALPKDAITHRADLAFRVPSYLDPRLRLEDFAHSPSLPSHCRPRVRRFLSWAAPRMRILAVHTETKAERMWPRERFSKVMNSFLERHPEFVILVLDFRKWRLTDGEFKDRIIQSPYAPLLYKFSMVEESDLFLGVDSCMLHAADLFRIPGVGLFGPTDPPRRAGFRFTRHRHVCDSRGMSHIREAAVLRALESLLS